LAVTTLIDQSHVFLLQDGKAVQQTVELGAKEGTKVEVKSGVKAGDVVVLSEGKRLVNGQTVRIAAKKS
jgi:multidrug efflux pump subunit AcrA (membrane-fusion protein)